MAEDLNKVMAHALPLASSVTDSDMLLMVQGGKNLRRVPPSLMKGKKGDQGDSSYLRYTGEWVQQKLGVNGAWVNLIPVSDMKGPSAYDLAVANGYKGTEVEWLSSLSQASEDAAVIALAAAKTAEETNASVSVAEGLRAEAERLRAEAEAFRAEAEKARAAAEADRVSTESRRAAAETLRNASEYDRLAQEVARAEAERIRGEAEQLRQSGEQSRIAGEDTRASSELKRNQSESERVGSENHRVEAELLRAAGEADRMKGEQDRMAAEDLRSAEEEKRITGETARASAEIDRESAEAARATAEELRIQAEARRAKDSAAAIADADAATARANTSAEAAQETADHPTYIGADHYVYKWNKETKAYDKTDIFVKGDAFSIRKVYESVNQMEADVSNPEIKEGDFVLINTDDVENPDNARLYIRASAGFDFLVDMSGAVGFTGKTPQLGIGTVSGGGAAAVSLSEDGTDPDGNPKFKLNLVLPKGDKGDTPVLTAGRVTTGAPGTPANADVVVDGVTDTGIPRYRLDLTIPRGDTGTGNVSVPAAELKAGATYLFKPSADGSAEGEFIEYIVPEQVQPDWNDPDESSDAYIRNKPALKPVATSGSYTDLIDKPTEIETATFAGGLKNNSIVIDLNNPIPANGLSWSNDSTKNTPPYKHGNIFQISNTDTPTFGDSWSWVNQLFFGTNGQIYHRNFSNTEKWGLWAKLAFSYEIPNLGNLTSNIIINNTNPTEGTKIGIWGMMAQNDYWGIYSYSHTVDEGCLEIATGDNGTEPIYVRQYAGHPISTSISEAVRTATLLDKNGNTDFPGTVSSGGKELVKTDDARLNDARYPLSVRIYDNADLNNYTTPGFYYCQANVTVATLKNCPTLNAFSLRVEHSANKSCIQFLSAFNPDTGLLYYRMIYNRDGQSDYIYGSWKRIYTTYDQPPLTDYFQGHNTATSLTSLPTNKRTIVCNLSAASGSFSFANALADGVDYYIIIHNVSSSAITQSLNIGSSPVFYGGATITIPAGGYAEVSVILIGSTFHVRSGGQ